MKYSIYQLKQTNEGKSMLFLTYQEAKNKINPKNYEKVWDGEVDEEEKPLDKIYEDLGKELPKGFYGHTPSISDVIVLEDGSAHYIDNIGFKMLDDFNVD